MSIPVELEDLVAATAERAFAYVITVGDDSTPHLVAAVPSWGDTGATITVGRSTLDNATARSAITLCYPPSEPGGYSLIVDGTAAAGEPGTIAFAPTGAVLHRPAAGAAGTVGAVEGCLNDCAPVPSSSPSAE